MPTAVPPAPRDRRTPRSTPAPGRFLTAVYGILAFAAIGRVSYQLLLKFDEAPFAYTLSALSAAVYILATVCLVIGSRASHHIAVAACVFEGIGVLVIGTLSFTHPEYFGHTTACRPHSAWATGSFRSSCPSSACGGCDGSSAASRPRGADDGAAHSDDCAEVVPIRESQSIPTVSHGLPRPRAALTPRRRPRLRRFLPRRLRHRRKSPTRACTSRVSRPMRCRPQW